MARLKTYAAEIDGLHDWIVAARNQRAALDALGVHQDLFAQGQAEPTSEPDLVEAATARPGMPLRRKKGSNGAFEPVSAAADWAPALSAAAAKAPKTKPVSRKALDEAESALAEYEAQASEEIAELEAEQDRLAQRLDRAHAAADQRRAELQKAVDKAEAAYREKGGR